MTVHSFFSNPYGKSNSWEASNFQQYIFLTSKLLISPSNDTGEHFCFIDFSVSVALIVYQ